MTVRVTGTLTLYGKTYPVDCVDTMDRSWGPRHERDMKAMSWSHGHFGESYCWHAIWQLRPGASPDDEFALAHGYILADGQVSGLTAGRMTAVRHEGLPVGLDLDLTDREGRRHRLTARALANHDWTCYTPLVIHHVFYEFAGAPAGGSGYGIIQEAYPIDTLARANGLAFTDRAESG
jgi:hypothetical protein